MLRQTCFVIAVIFVLSLKSSQAGYQHKLGKLFRPNHKHDDHHKSDTDEDSHEILKLPSVVPINGSTSQEKKSSKEDADSVKLVFKLSARSLPAMDRFGKSDPYVIISYTQNKVKGEVGLGRTDTIKDTLNPDWGETFKMTYVRGQKQRLHLVVWDKDLTNDDLIGEVWIKVGEYVRNDQFKQINLKEGYLIIEKA